MSSLRVASYRLRYSLSVEKDLPPIPRSFVARMIVPIEHVPTDPFPHQLATLQGPSVCIAREVECPLHDRSAERESRIGF